MLADTRPDLRGWEYDYLHRLCYGDLVTLDHGSRVLSAAFSHDRSKLLTFTEGCAFRIWDVATGKALTGFQVKTGGVICANFSRDGSKIVTGNNANYAIVWDAATGKNLTECKGHAGFIRSVAFSTGGTKVITASEDTTAQIWDAANGKSAHQTRRA